MSCGCKSNQKNEGPSINKDENFKKNVAIFFQTIIKFIGFLIFLLLIPLINVFIVIQAFKMIMFSQQLHLKPLLDRVTSLAKPKQKEEKEEDIDISTLTKDDVIMLDVEDISPKKKALLAELK